MSGNEKYDLCRDHAERLSKLDVKIDLLIDNQKEQYNRLLNALLTDNKNKNKTLDKITNWTFKLLITAGMIALGIKNFLIGG